MHEDDLSRDPVIVQAERIRKNAEFSKDVQFEAAKRLKRRSTVLGAVSTVGATAGGLGLLADGGWLWSVAALIAAVTSFLSVAGDSAGRAEKAAAVGHQYVKLRNDADVFINIDYSDMSDLDARQRLEELLLQEDGLNCRISLASDKDARKVKSGSRWWCRGRKALPDNQSE